MDADVVISAAGAMSGDARQEAESQQCKTNKKKTVLKPPYLEMPFGRRPVNKSYKHIG